MIQNILSRWLSGPWSIMPEAWQGLQVALKGYIDDKLPHERLLCEARPTKDLWGNPIPQMRTERGVTIVPVNGALVKGATPFEKLVFGVASYEDFKEDMRNASARGTPILMHFNSPGGMVIGGDEACAAIAETSASRIVASYTEDLMGSMAYEMAAPSMIFASPSSIVGSVGAYMKTASMHRMLESVGIDVEVFRSGKYKAAGDPHKEMTDDEREMFQDKANKYGDEFRSFVLEHRDIDPDDMEGQTFTGKEAVGKGFVDFNASSIDEVIEQMSGC